VSILATAKSPNQRFFGPERCLSGKNKTVHRHYAEKEDGDNMKKTLFLVSALLASLSLSSCQYFTDKGTTERFTVEYTDESIDKESLDTYFLDNEEFFPSYQELKTNVPTILDNVKKMKSNSLFLKNVYP